MLKALNTAATGMQAQQTQLDVTANNMANVNTNAFKRSRAEFEDLLYQTIREPGAQTAATTNHPTGVQTGLGVKVASTQKIFEMGPAKVTRNPLDVSIEGQGFLGVQLPSGQVGYTRDGQLHKDMNGRVVDKNGNPIVPEINIPQGATSINISDNGMVEVTVNNSTQASQVGQIQLANFVNPAGLKSIGKNIYLPTGASGAPTQGNPGENGLGSLAQGQLEASNVNVVDEMVNMISTQRAYETNSKIVQAADQMLQYSNNLR